MEKKKNDDAEITTLLTPYISSMSYLLKCRRIWRVLGIWKGEGSLFGSLNIIFLLLKGSFDDNI